MLSHTLNAEIAHQRHSEALREARRARLAAQVPVKVSGPSVHERLVALATRVHLRPEPARTVAHVSA